jgi:hypothetical protein
MKTPPPDSFNDQKELSRLDYPEVRDRCVKLKWTSRIQTAFLGLGLILLFATLFLLELGYHGSTSRRSHRYHPPIPAFIPYGYAALGIGLALLTSLLGIRNYSLLDPVTHRLYHHLQFLWWRKRKIVFREGEVLAVTAEGQRRSSKYSTYWVYRTVAVGKDGRRVPLSNWRRNELEACNAKARQLAPHLGCEGISAPAESRVLVETESGKPAIRFESSTWPLNVRRFSGIVIAIIIGLVYFFLMMKTRR